MKFIARVITLLAVCLQTMAKVDGMNAPPTAPAGGSVSIMLTLGGSATTFQDFGIAWGFYRDGDCSTDDCIGTIVNYDNLYGESQPTPGTVNYTVSVPGELSSGDKRTFVAAIPYLVGAVGEMNIRYFKQDMTII